MKEKIIEFIKTPIITSILIFIMGAILFTNPENVVKIVTYGLGGILLLLGFIRFAHYLGDRKLGKQINNDLVYAVVVMTSGVVIIVCTSMIELALRFIMGAFILYNGIIRLILSLKLKETATNIWKGNLIVAIVILGVGLYIILKSNLVFSGIGLLMMIYAGLEIALSIMNYKNNNIIIKK